MCASEGSTHERLQRSSFGSHLSLEGDTMRVGPGLWVKPGLMLISMRWHEAECNFWAHCLYQAVPAPDTFEKAFKRAGRLT